MALDFDSLYPWSDIEQVTIDGQSMVKIPKYYVKYGTISTGRNYVGKKARWVSEEKPSGYHIHPAFVKNGKVMECFYIGAYEAYNAGSNTAGSATNKAPWANIGGFENAKTYCKKRGDDWHLQNIYEVAAVNILLLIEIGTPDVQTAIDVGNAYTTGGPQNTGTTNAIWRGIHEWWGNVWEHVDGLTTDANGIYQIFSNQMDGTYVSTGVTNPSEGWITEMSEAKGTNFDLTDVFLPLATSTTEGDGTYGDYAMDGKNTCLTRSAHWARGTRCGAFTSNCAVTKKYGDRGTSLRIAKYGNLTNELAA